MRRQLRLRHHRRRAGLGGELAAGARLRGAFARNQLFRMVRRGRAATAAVLAGAAAGCAVPRYVRQSRRELAAPTRAAAVTTNGRTASLIYATRTGAGVVVVDLGWSRAGRALDQALGELGATRADVAAVLLTHSHRDHIGAWRALRTVPFYLGAAEVPLFDGERHHAGWAARAADWVLAPHLPRRGELRVVPVAGDTVLAFGADTVRGFAAPGHTAGSMAWLVRDVLFLGDDASAHVGNGHLRKARGGYAGSVTQARRSLARVRRAVAPYRVRLLCTAHARCAEPSDRTWEAISGG